MLTAEILAPPDLNHTGTAMMEALARSAPLAGITATVSHRYHGDADWLVTWGVGGGGRSQIRDRHIASGRRVVLWDMGFFGRGKMSGYCKASVDYDYCTPWLDQTEPDPQRWNALGLSLRDNADVNGHIVLAGIGPKQHNYIGKAIDGWEQRKLGELRQRFPGRRILYRPKPGRRFVPLRGCEMDNTSPIEDVLKGASLAVAMHSNVALDAVIAGVPFECETNVSTWMRDKPFTSEARLDFVRRLAWWQWRVSEAKEAWHFLRRTLAA